MKSKQLAIARSLLRTEGDFPLSFFHFTYTLPLHLLLEEPVLDLLVLAAFVLKPDPDHSGREASHLHELLLHERVRSGVRRVARLEDVELLLAEDGAGAGTLAVAAFLQVAATRAAAPAASVDAERTPVHLVVAGVDDAHLLVREVARGWKRRASETMRKVRWRESETMRNLATPSSASSHRRIGSHMRSNDDRRIGLYE